MSEYEKLLAQAITKLDNINVPVAFINSISLPIAQVSGILRAICTDIQTKRQAEELKNSKPKEEENESGGDQYEKKDQLEGTVQE